MCCFCPVTLSFDKVYEQCLQNNVITIYFIKLSKNFEQWKFSKAFSKYYSFLFSCQTLVFLFLTLLSLGAKIKCPQYRNTDLKLGLNKLLNNVLWLALKKNCKKSDTNVFPSCPTLFDLIFPKIFCRGLLIKSCYHFC